MYLVNVIRCFEFSISTAKCEYNKINSMERLFEMRVCVVCIVYFGGYSNQNENERILRTNLVLFAGLVSG